MKKVVTAPARRELVRHLVDKGLSERRLLAVVRMSDLHPFAVPVIAKSPIVEGYLRTAVRCVCPAHAEIDHWLG